MGDWKLAGFSKEYWIPHAFACSSHVLAWLFFLSRDFEGQLLVSGYLRNQCDTPCIFSKSIQFLMLSRSVRWSEIIKIISASFPACVFLNISLFLFFLCFRWMWCNTISTSTASQFDIQTCHVLSWANPATAIPWSLSPSWEAGWNLKGGIGLLLEVGTYRITTIKPLLITIKPLLVLVTLTDL